MNKLLLNTQIEALTSIHGAEIVRFYKSQGFDTKSLSGVSTKAASDYHRYYGVNDIGFFTNRQLEDNHGIKLITLEEAEELLEEKTLFTIQDLANGKCTLLNDGTIDELQKVLGKAGDKQSKGYSGISDYYWCINGIWGNGSRKHDLSTQSVKDFLKQINTNMKKEGSRFPFNLSAKDAQSIINIACTAWKEKLASRWGAAIVLSTNTKITEDDYKEMRKVCTPSQNDLFDEIFW